MFVDVSVIARHDARTGIQRVVRAIWAELARIHDPKFEFVPVIAGRTHGYCFAHPQFMEGRRHRTKAPVGAREGDKFLGLDLTAHYLPGCTTQLEAWRRAGATTHFIVYDLLPITHPHWFSETSREHFERWFEVVKGHADQALCISDAVREQVREKIGCATLPKVGRLRLSGDIASSVPSMGVSGPTLSLLNEAEERPLVLMIGTVEPRKGYDVALRAFEHLWETRASEAPDLVIIGKPGWMTGETQDRLRNHPLAGQRLHWLDSTSDEELSLLYRASKGLLMASFAEGFGLPVLEAAMHGRWVLARDLAVFREQQVPGIMFFDDEAPEPLGRRLLDLLSASDLPPPRVRLPTWEECVDGLLDELGLAATSTGSSIAANREGADPLLSRQEARLSSLITSSSKLGDE